MITCKACRAELPDGSAFCGHCGAKVKPVNPAKQTAFGLGGVSAEELELLQAAREAASREELAQDIPKAASVQRTQAEHKPEPAIPEPAPHEKDTDKLSFEQLNAPAPKPDSDSPISGSSPAAKKKKKKKRPGADTINQTKADTSSQTGAVQRDAATQSLLESVPKAEAVEVEDQTQAEQTPEITQKLDTQELKKEPVAKAVQNDSFVVHKSLIEMGDEEEEEEEIEEEGFDPSSEHAFFGGSMSQILPALQRDEIKAKSSSKSVFAIIIIIIALAIIGLSIALFVL